MLISIAAHLGTLFAVVFCYRKRIVELIRRPLNTTNLNLIIATIPTILTVLIFHSFLDKSFSISSIIWGFLISSLLLTISDLIKDRNLDINKRRSIFMGIGQSLALLPGISRSGTTLCFGLISGINKEKALDFSFLMSIPVILCSVVYECIKLSTDYSNVSILSIITTIVSSFIFGILSIKLMLKLIKNNNLYYFAIYLIVISLVLLLAI